MMSALWAIASPYVAKAVQWALWLAVFVANAALTVYESHKTETIAAVLWLIVGLSIRPTLFQAGAIAALVFASWYSGRKEAA